MCYFIGKGRVKLSLVVSLVVSLVLSFMNRIAINLHGN